jgi:hypothetical protein
VPPDEQAKIAGGNTARVYRFDVPKLGAPSTIVEGQFRHDL